MSTLSVNGYYFQKNLPIMTCIIVEENDFARANLRRLATTIDDLTVEAEYPSAMEAYQDLQAIRVDLILLDVDAPDQSGLEFTRRLKSCAPLVVFTAAKKQYAAEAFDLDVADYLLKPVSPERFFRAIDKVRDLMRSRAPARSADEEHIFIRDSTVLRRLRLDDVLFAEAMGDYVKLHTRQRVHCIHVRFRAMEERLSQGRFIRVHRSFIVALDKIDSVQDGGVHVDGHFVPVTGTYRKVLASRIRVI
jgi:two-component system LytT family response regulator